MAESNPRDQRLPKPSQGEPQSDGGITETQATVVCTIIFVLVLLILWKLFP